MPLCYEKNKQHIYNWRHNHVEEQRELSRKYSKTYYEKECYYSFDRYAKQLRKIIY